MRRIAIIRGGITIASATGHIIADLLAGTEPRFSTDSYSTDRSGENARNPEWLVQETSDSPSGNYARSDQDE